ncbi:hypothetical protein QBC45DRAFT_102585 [Copromyces sp. CBS 386.78]|nr:hypothetical protein QBC45DRAFT_102585 [Copromyces sp. CBS 386.78]
MVFVFLANLHLNPPLVFLYSVCLSVVSPIEVRLSKVGTGTPIPSMLLMYMILRTLAFFLSCISLFPPSVPRRITVPLSAVLREQAVAWHCWIANLSRSPGNMSGLSPFYLAGALDVR